MLTSCDQRDKHLSLIASCLVTVVSVEGAGGSPPPPVLSLRGPPPAAPVAVWGSTRGLGARHLTACGAGLGGGDAGVGPAPAPRRPSPRTALPLTTRPPAQPCNRNRLLPTSPSLSLCLCLSLSLSPSLPLSLSLSLSLSYTHTHIYDPTPQKMKNKMKNTSKGVKKKEGICHNFPLPVAMDRMRKWCRQLCTCWCILSRSQGSSCAVLAQSRAAIRGLGWSSAPLM